MSSVITVDPEIHSGVPCFAGTRVPVETFFDHLEAGDPLEVFLEDFPTVTRSQVEQLLRELPQLALHDASRIGA